MKKWSFYTAKEIKPEGWLRRQLEIEAAGLTGNLDKIWPDVRDSAWIGGDREGWERVPYWLDGFIPLAYLLENEDMIQRAKRYVDAILASQRESGWICPCTEEEIPSYDTWALQLIAKVLVVYYECSGDERIPSVVYRILKNYHDLLSEGRIALKEWGKYRWFETFISLNFLKERYDEAWISSLAAILYAQGTKVDSLPPLWHAPRNEWTLDTHIVNIAMLLKYEAVSADLLGVPYTDKAETLRTLLDAYHGTPVGSFTGDECLSGRSPIQGTELCAIVEQMYSYEQLYAYTGDPKWAERLELLAFNALPATVSDDMWTHQYVQQSNQIACRTLPGRSVFRTNGPEAHLFGLEPQYGCCTSNMGQGFPKLALSTFLHREGRVLSALSLPATLSTEHYTVSLHTEYPFKNAFTYAIEAKESFTLDVRVPSFAKNLTVDGERLPYTEMLSFSIEGGEKREIRIVFDTLPVLKPRANGLFCVSCGSLVFSLPIAYEARMHEYERAGVERKFPYCDYEYLPTSAWNYALADVSFEREEKKLSSIPFSSKDAPVLLWARVKPISWGFEEGFDSVCAKVPASLSPLGEEERIALVPYGCAKLRMTELPLI